MKMTDIKYEPVQIEEGLKELSEGTLAEAASVLGYRPDRPSLKPVEAPLAAALHRLGVEVLNKKQVREYVIEKAIENTKEAIAEELTMENRFRLDCYVGYAVQMTEIEKYGRQIPEHILSRAIEIKRAIPEVKFYVMSIERDPDPFLIAELNEEFFFIGVWAEVGFERR